MARNRTRYGLMQTGINCPTLTKTYKSKEEAIAECDRINKFYDEASPHDSWIQHRQYIVVEINPVEETVKENNTMGFTRTWNWNGSQLTLDVLKKLIADCEDQQLPDSTKVSVKTDTSRDPRDSGLTTIYLTITA